MPFAYMRNTEHHGPSYCIATCAQEAFEGRGALLKELPKDMKDLKLITYLSPSTGRVKFKQVTEP